MERNEQIRRLSSRDRILHALKAAGEKGATNTELVSICFLYRARIFELRNLGHNIESHQEADGIWRFILREPVVATQIPLIEGWCSHAT